MLRHFASVTGLPFEITREKANETLTKNIGFFEKIGDDPEVDNSNNEIVISKKDPIEKKYLPFYSIDIKNLTSEFTGQYGHDRTEMYTYWVYNASTKTMIPMTGYRTVTDWYDCNSKYCYTEPIDRPFKLTKTQIYAGFEYPKEHVENTLRTEEVIEIQEIKVSKGTIVSPHEMKMNYAVEKINSELFKMEEIRIKHQIIEKWNCDRAKVNHIDMRLDKADIEMKVYHMPAYIYNYEMSGNKFHKIIGGFDGKIHGNSIKDPFKTGVAGVIMGGLTGLAYIAGGPAFAVSTTIARILIPAGVVGGIGTLMGYMSSGNQNYSNEYSIKKEKDNDAKHTETDDDRNIREEYEEIIRTTETGDILSLLGLTANSEINLEILKKHYHKEIKKWHPDIYHGDKKKYAENMTKQIIVAYEKLKKQYDTA